MCVFPADSAIPRLAFWENVELWVKYNLIRYMWGSTYKTTAELSSNIRPAQSMMQQELHLSQICRIYLIETLNFMHLIAKLDSTHVKHDVWTPRARSASAWFSPRVRNRSRTTQENVQSYYVVNGNSCFVMLI